MKDVQKGNDDKTVIAPPLTCSATPSTLDVLKKTDKQEMGVYAIMVILNLANAGLVMIKGVAAYVSCSFSIGTSAIESFGDVFVSILLLVQYMLDKRVSKTEYPRGRSSEATTNLTASVVMMALAFVNFIQSFDALITGQLEPEFSEAHIAVVILNIVVKLFLFLICVLKRDNNQIRVLMRDQLTDVLTNSIALAAICIAYFIWKECDFIGATIIFVLIIRNWAPIVSESWFKLQGVKGDDDVNEKISNIIAKNQELFSELAGYVTYHIGNKCIVEIYCTVADNFNRSNVFEKFENNEDVQAVYILPVDEVKNASVLRVEPQNPNLSSNPDEQIKLLQTV